MDELKQYSRAILRRLTNSPVERCVATFLEGHKSYRIPLFLALATEWSKSKESQADFVVLAATQQKAARLRIALRTLQMSRASQALQQGQDLVGDPEDVKIDVQAGAEFLHCNHRPAPGKRYVIIVDALFPDSSTWDHSIYASLQAWAAFRDQAKTWARICLFQPQPESGWYGQFNEATIIFGTQPEEREVEVQQDDKYVENLVGAIASELDTISTAMPDSDVMIVCDEALIQALGTWLPTHSFENRYFIQLTATEQEEAVKKAASANNPASFLVTFGITNVYCEIKNLRAILYVDPQNREVYSAGLRTVSMTKSSMSIGDIDYCRELLTRHANKDNASLLCRFKKQGDTSRPKRQILVDPFVTVFLIVGMLKGCRVRILSQLIKLPHHVSIYVNKLIKLEFLQETRGSSASTEDIHTLDRVVTLRHDRAEETFYLMMKADRTDLGLCWIEAGISPPANDQISRVTIDATRALTLLIALLRHRRLGRAGITIDYTANTQGKDVPMIINERINSNLPLHLRNWAHMGLPWLLILLCDKVIRDKSFLSDTNPWVQVLPHITMDSAFLRSMSDDIDRIRCRSFYGGPIFAFGGDLNTSSHVTTCYELVMRQILDAFSYRLVCLNNLHHEPRAFEFFTGVTHHIDLNALNQLLVRRLLKEHIKPDGTCDGLFGIYFKSTVEDEKSIIDDILIVPDDVVLEWRQRTGIAIERVKVQA